MNFTGFCDDIQLRVLLHVDEWTLLSFRETNKKFWRIIEREDDLYCLKCTELFKQDTKTEETWRDTFFSLSRDILSHIQKGNLSALQDLFNKGALDVNNLNIGGITHLSTAAMTNQLDVARFLLEKGADVNARCEPDGMTALLFAVKWGHLKMVKLLLENGADMEMETNYSGQTIFDFFHIAYPEVKDYILCELEKRQPVFGEDWQNMIDGMSQEIDRICAEVM